MSELKTYNSERIYWAVEQVEQEAGDIEDLHLDDNLFYIKSEADKVIAELNAQVDFLKTTHDSCGNCNRCADGMSKVLNEQLDELKKKLIKQTTLRMWAEMQLHHNKYKRCLAVAMGCRRNRLHSSVCGPVEKIDFWEKWRKRWLELAKKFKEAK
jgi:NADH:ubiquinone oxidoreductase subunit F (NADH-binding)